MLTWNKTRCELTTMIFFESIIQFALDIYILYILSNNLAELHAATYNMNQSLFYLLSCMPRLII